MASYCSAVIVNFPADFWDIICVPTVGPSLLRLDRNAGIDVIGSADARQVAPSIAAETLGQTVGSSPQLWKSIVENKGVAATAGTQPRAIPNKAGKSTRRIWPHDCTIESSRRVLLLRMRRMRIVLDNQMERVKLAQRDYLNV